MHLKQVLGKIGFLTLCKLTGLNCIEIQGNLGDGETEKEKVSESYRPCSDSGFLSLAFWHRHAISRAP